MGGCCCCIYTQKEFPEGALCKQYLDICIYMVYMHSRNLLFVCIERAPYFMLYNLCYVFLRLGTYVHVHYTHSVTCSCTVNA